MWHGGGGEQETGFVRTGGGVRIFYRRMGGDGPTVLLLHGWPQTGHAWRRLVPTLASSGYTVVAPDLRGSGQSDKPSGGYDALSRMEDVREMLHALELGREPIFVAGHGDDGALVAHAYANAHRDEVAGLALISPVSLFSWSSSSAHQWHLHFHQTPDLPELLIAPQLEVYLRHFFQSWSHDPHMLAESDLAVYVGALSQPGALRASLAPFRTALEDYWALCPDTKTPLDAPVLLVCGESDPRTTFDPLHVEEKHMARDLRIETIPHGGYWLPEERPDAVATALLTFFGGVRSLGSGPSRSGEY